MHFIVEAADGRSPVRAARTYFLSQGVLTPNLFASELEHGVSKSGHLKVGEVNMLGVERLGEASQDRGDSRLGRLWRRTAVQLTLPAMDVPAMAARIRPTQAYCPQQGWCVLDNQCLTTNVMCFAPHDEWSVPDHQWSVFDNQWSVPDNQWSVFDNQWSVLNNQWYVFA